MNYPRVSIVTPCFNHEQYIAETIESVISQDYPNIQYIVINDGSTDGSGEIIRSYQNHICHIIELDGYRPGPVWAINHGFKLADGEILGWISSDDILLPKSLFTLAKVFTDLPQVEWLTGLASAINVRSEVVKCQSCPKSLYDYLSGNWKVIQQESTFFRKCMWDRAGGRLNEEWLQAFDTELWTRFFAETTHYELQAPLGAFRKGKQSRSVRNINEFLTYNIKALEKMKKGASYRERFLAYVYGLLRTRPLRKTLRLIPERLIQNIFPKCYSDLWIKYHFEEDRWVIDERSAFRR